MYFSELKKKKLESASLSNLQNTSDEIVQQGQTIAYSNGRSGDITWSCYVE